MGAAKVAEFALIAPVADNDGAIISAVASRSVERARAYAQKHSIPAISDDYQALVEREDINLVYNALPPSEHAVMTIAALRAGKPVLCEKPFAMNANEARQMVSVAQETGLPLIEAFHYRFHPAFSFVLDELRKGKIGTVQSITGRLTGPIPNTDGELRHIPELGGGALMDLGCYPVHLLRTLMGDEPTVTEAKAVMSESGVDLGFGGHLRFPCGARGKVVCSMALDANLDARLEIVGDAGKIDFVNPLAPHIGHKITITTGEEKRSKVAEDKTTYACQLEHVLNVLAGAAQPLTGGGDAIANMTVIDNLYAAAGVKRI
ncbi:MAG: Gfo/Idh/MocA family oxidoreductase [Parasphingorhabdus sp.]